MDKILEIEIIQKAQLGDEEAFEKLIKKYGKVLLSDIKCKNIWNNMDVEDIYQEVVVKLWKNIRKINPQKGFINYAREVTKNSIIDFYKKASRTKSISYDQTLNNFESQRENSLKDIIADDKENTENIAINELVLFEKCNLLLEILCKNIDPPNQVIAFGLNKLVAQTNKGKVQHIVTELSDKNLYDLLIIFRNEYIKDARIPERKVNEHFKCLFDKLDKTEEGIKIGDKKLKDYFHKKPQDNISQWSNYVIDKVRRYVDENYLDIFKE